MTMDDLHWRARTGCQIELVPPENMKFREGLLRYRSQ